MRHGRPRRRGAVKLGLGLGVGSAGSSFSPASVSTGLAQWLKAGTGMFQDAARTTAAVADADPLGGIADQSGSGRHASQSTAGFRPTLRLNAQNGNPVIRFDGVDDFLAANGVGTLLTGSDVPFTWFAAFKKAGAAGSHELFSLYNSGGGTRLHRVMVDATAGNYDVFRRDDGGTAAERTGGTANTSWHTAIQVFTGTAVTLYIDGTAVVNNLAMDVGVLTLDSFALGALSGGSEFLSGDIGETGVYSVALGATPVSQLQSYLKAKWGTP